MPASTFHVASTLDLAILQLNADPPSTARPLPFRTDVSIVRGERVVLGGNPSSGNPHQHSHNGVLPFQTTEGVVTGHISGPEFAQCGPNRNCLVVDTASFSGSSGGPVFNTEGQLVGMLWGGPQLASGAHNPAFAYVIHARTIVAEFRRIERR